MNPLFDKDAGFAIAMSILVSAGFDAEKRRRIDRQICEDTLDRCGFKLVPVVNATDNRPVDTVIVNADGQPLNRDEKIRLEDVFHEVKADYAKLEAAAKKRREDERLQAEARREAEYAAAAQPWRELRKQRKAAAFAKRNNNE